MKHFLNTHRIGIGCNGCEECDLIVSAAVDHFFCEIDHDGYWDSEDGWYEGRPLTARETKALAGQIVGLEPCYECEEE